MIADDGMPIAVSARGESIALYGAFAASFLILLVVAVAAQLLAMPWRRWLPGAEGEKSLVGGVRSAVYNFMSYLK